MSESPYIHNVDMQNFQQIVLEKSMQKPVLVDFWADWCAPCQQLAPILEKLADEYAGKFEVAKINADSEQDLAAHFGVKSLPTMKLFFQGRIVDERTGLGGEADLRKMLDQHVVSEAKQMMQAALAAYQQGQTQQALDLLNQALVKDPENQELKVQIAQLVYAEGDQASAVSLLDSLDAEGAKLDGAIQLRAEIELAEQLKDLPALDEIEKRLEKNPRDLEALIMKSRHLTARGDYENAMECLLEIMRIDREYENDAGRKNLLALFDLLGGEHPSVQHYRRKLFTLLH